METIKKLIILYYNSDKDISELLDLSYSRPGQDVRYALDDSKLRSIGWYPKKDFDIELPNIVEYYKNKFIW